MSEMVEAIFVLAVFYGAPIFWLVRKNKEWLKKIGLAAAWMLGGWIMAAIGLILFSFGLMFQGVIFLLLGMLWGFESIRVTLK